MQNCMPPPTRSCFIPDTFTQFAWDSTSLGYLKTCPRLYQYIMIDGWTSSVESAHLRFGLEYHKALEDYDRYRAGGLTSIDATRQVLRELLFRTADFDPDPDTKAGKYKNTKSLIQMVINYIDDHQSDACKTFIKADGNPAVELSFSFELDWGPQKQMWGPYLLCGHIDRVVNLAGDLYVMDRKAQPISTAVLGQYGWIEIGLLQVGDLIAGKDGKFYPIKGLYPKGVTKVYEITFNDRTSVRCAEDHIWSVADQFTDHFRDYTLKEMLSTLENKPYKKFHIPLVAPIQHPEATLPIDPYVLGALIGNGYLAGSTIQLSTSDPTLAANVEQRLNGDRIKKNKGNNLTWTITGGRTLQGIRDLDLRVKSAHKHIPDEYLFASEEQRRDLLQGLLDTDGSLNYGHQRYQSMSAQLIEDVSELVRSLGGTSRTTRRADGCYRASIRMQELNTGVGRRYIASIEEVDPEETVCIETEAPDHLYVTEHYIVTHNTTTSTAGSYFFNQFSPNNQMTLYSLAAKVILSSPVRGVIIDAAQILLTAPYSAFTRGVVYHTPAQLDEWLHDLRYWLTLAESYSNAGYWPQNDTACDKFGGCRFREVCSKSSEVREVYLKSSFTQLLEEDRWNPLKPR